LKELRRVFALFDLDGGGTMSCNELQDLGEVRRELRGADAKGWTKEKNEKMMREIDKDTLTLTLTLTRALTLRVITTLALAPSPSPTLNPKP